MNRLNQAILKILLCCMILTCLTSGTMAIYTTKIDEAAKTTITAKRFFIGVNSASEFDVKLAPNEKAQSTFTITNADSSGLPTEVDMSLTIAANYSSLYQAIPGIKAYLTEDGSDRVVEANADGTFFYSESRAFLADVKSERTFHMVFQWEATTENQVAASGKTVGDLALYITGTQYIP